MRSLICVIALAFCLGLPGQTQSGPVPDVSGVTMNSKGEPLRKVDLILLPLAKNEVGEPMPSYCVVSESDGKFEFYGIPPGRYRLMADRAGHLRTRYGAKTEWGAGTTLELRRGAPISGLELRLPEQGVISGKLKFEGSPASLYLALYQQKFQNGQRTMVSVGSTQVERSGEFLFNKLRPGTYFLLGGQWYRRRRTRNRAKRLSSQPITLARRMRAPPLQLQYEAGRPSLPSLRCRNRESIASAEWSQDYRRTQGA